MTAQGAFLPLVAVGADSEAEPLFLAQVKEVSRLGLAMQLLTATSDSSDGQDPCLDGLRWLQAHVDGGSFDFDVAGPETSRCAADALPRLVAMVQFLNWVICPPPAPGGILSIRLDPTPEFLTTFANLARRVSERAGTERPIGAARSPAYVSCVATVMMGAAALDLGVEVEALAEACPEAMTHPLQVPVDAVGPPWQRLLSHGFELAVTPYYAAIQFSSHTAVAALLHAGLPGNAPLAFRLSEPSQERFTVHGFDAVTCWDVFDPTGAVDVLTDAMLRRNSFVAVGEGPRAEDGHYEQQLTARLCASLKRRPGHDFLADRLPAFLAARAFDADVVPAVRSAAWSGRADILRHLRDKIDWAGLPEGARPVDLIVAIAVSSKSEPDSAGFEDACLELLGMAQEAACPDTFEVVSLSAIYDDATARAQPIHALIAAGFSRALGKYMDEGFDPHLSYVGLPAAVTVASEMANEKAFSVLASIQAYGQRARVQELLTEIESCSRARP
ncbi:hypothetical protein ACSFA0_25065 [Variovorax sp. LT1P1]|uniref:hypothetical protein n=1 Tax=Variovorax sp. LT1P1 TaxID=3443730 RepID=UPI003F447082